MGLTETELKILDAMIGGCSTNKQLATALELTESATKMHISRLLAKTKCRNRAALAAKWAALNEKAH